MVPKSDHLANPRFDKKPSAQAGSRTLSWAPTSWAPLVRIFTNEKLPFYLKKNSWEAFD